MTPAINIIGAGAFGTALAIAYGQAGHPVSLWARNRVIQLRASRENTAYLPGARLPETVTVTGDITALTADITLVALPTQTLAGFFETAPLRGSTIVSTSKGIDLTTGRRPSEVLAAAAPQAGIAQLTGPSFAADIAQGLPTALTLACPDAARAETLQNLLSTPTLRLYRSTDLIGAELGGALKNVVAIAAGAVIGANLGESARAALIARGFSEMCRVAEAAGADPTTLTGLSGLGDLILTAGSDKSRNFRFGQALAQGATLEDGTTVEGVHTARQLAARTDIDTPIADAVAALADGVLDIHQILEALLSRPLRSE